jgi:hypothetical protein
MDHCGNCLRGRSIQVGMLVDWTWENVAEACNSPLTSSIYFPAIPTLTRAFGKSTELINLTVRFPYRCWRKHRADALSA